MNVILSPKPAMPNSSPIRYVLTCTTKNREREIEGLKDACGLLDRKQGFLLTDNEEDELSMTE